MRTDKHFPRSYHGPWFTQIAKITSIAILKNRAIATQVVLQKIP